MPGLGDENREPTRIMPLRMLLGAVTMMLLVAAAGRMLWLLGARDWSGAAGPGALMIVLAGAGAALYRIGSPSVRGLRIVERVVFSAAAAYLAWMGHVALQHALASGDSVRVVSHWNGVLIQFVMLMVLYGIAVPNRWTRAVRVVTGLAVLPYAVALASPAWDGVAGQALGVAVPVWDVRTAFVLLAGAGIAVFAAHVIDQYLEMARQTRITLRYVLRRRIGGGGMGEVWLAEHEMLARPAAVKLIRRDLVSGDSAHAGAMLARFEREAQATARLRSPHTVEIYDFGVAGDGTFYYVMEYLEGVDLHTLVRRHGPLPSGRVVYLLRQACVSLAEAHSYGMVHRDIKPANIFACRLGGAYDFVKVLDFGLVSPGDMPEFNRRVGELTVEGQLGGTPGYMAPELVVGGTKADGRADIYALGCVAYYLLTGSPLFEGTPMSVLVDHVRTTPPAPSGRSEQTVSAELDRVVMRCLAKDPADRFQNMSELADALAACEPDPGWSAAEAAAWWRLHWPEGGDRSGETGARGRSVLRSKADWVPGFGTS